MVHVSQGFGVWLLKCPHDMFKMIESRLATRFEIVLMQLQIRLQRAVEQNDDFVFFSDSWNAPEAILRTWSFWGWFCERNPPTYRIGRIPWGSPGIRLLSTAICFHKLGRCILWSPKPYLYTPGKSRGQWENSVFLLVSLGIKTPKKSEEQKNGHRCIRWNYFPRLAKQVLIGKGKGKYSQKLMVWISKSQEFLCTCSIRDPEIVTQISHSFIVLVVTVDEWGRCSEI